MSRVCRTSALPSFRLCASFITDRDYRLSEPSEAGDNGSATHALLAGHVIGMDLDYDSVLSRYPDAERSEVLKLFAFGRAAWRRLAAFFPNAQTEQRLESDLTAGTADVIGRGDPGISILDWKTGYRYTDATWQLGGYAYSARAEFGMPDSGTIKTAVVWLRLGEVEVRDWDSDRLDIFAELVREQAKGIGSAFNPGEHCSYCDGRNSCAAREDWIRTTTHALTETSPAEITPAKLASLYPQARALEALLKEYNSALRATVAESGKLALPDGRELYMQEKNYQSVLPREAWPILQKEFEFSDQDMQRCLKMSKSEVQNIAAEKAPPRGKGKAKKEILERLDTVGAVIHTRRQSLAVRKGKPDEGSD